MDLFLTFLMVAVPSIVVFLTAFFILKNFSDKELYKKRYEVKMKNQSLITPIRLQAYERLTLFLERIEPNSMIMRVSAPNMTSKQLQSELLTSIRTEFEHNLSQQIYISQPAWEVIKSAKENTVKIINSSMDDVQPESPSIELSKMIFSRIIDAGKSPTNIAVEFIKKEVSQYF